MRIQLILFSAWLTLAGVQATAQQVSYTVIENDPTLVPRLQVYFEPISFEAWAMGRMSISWQTGGRWDINNRLSIFANYRQAGPDAADMMHYGVRNAHNKEYDEFAPLKMQELYGRINLISKTVTRDIKVGLSSHSSGGYTYSSYVMVPGEMKRYFGLRGGIMRYAGTFQVGEDDPVVTSDGVSLSAHGAYDADGNELASRNNALYWGVNQRVTCLAAGLSWTKITALVIDADGYGKKKHAGKVDVSLDVLYAPKPVLEEIHFADQSFDVSGNGENQLKPSHLGWQFKMETMTARRHLNFGYSCTFGSRPGIEGNNYFLQAGIRFPVIGIRVPALPGGMDA